MKILFFSDIHGITKNLNKIDNIISLKKFDKIVVLGDLYYIGFNKTNLECDNFKVRSFLEKYKDRLIVMKGTCDSLVDIEKSRFKIIKDISLLNVDDIDIYITHGNSYNIYNNDTFCNGVMVYGHEHIPYIRKDSDMIYINTGSISLPRDDNGATYAIYENKCFTIYSVDDNRIIDSINIEK